MACSKIGGMLLVLAGMSLLAIVSITQVGWSQEAPPARRSLEAPSAPMNLDLRLSSEWAVFLDGAAGEDPPRARTSEEQFWNAADEPRVSLRWRRRSGVIIENSPALESYSPFRKSMTEAYCRLLCDSVAGCAGVAWTCARRCFLQGPLQEGAREKADGCTVSYMKSAPTAAPYQDFQVLGLSAAFEALPLPQQGGGLVVVSLRCRQAMHWLVPLARNVSQHLGLKAQIVVYERCVTPAQHSTQLGGVPLRRQSVQPIFSAGLAVVAHLLVNMRAHASGAFTHSLFVDADLREDEVQRVLGAASWERWILADFAEAVISSAQLLASSSGVHLAETGGPEAAAALAALEERLSRVAPRMVTWGQPDYVWDVGLSKCAPESHAAVPLSHMTRPPRTAIVTYLSDSAFATVARVLLHSLRKAGCKSEIVVATMVASQSVAQALQQEFPDVRLLQWPYIRPPEGSKAQARWVDNYSKLNLFNMSEYDAILYMDADMVALQNPEALFAHRIVQASRLPFLGTPDWGKWEKPPSPKLNGGVFYLRPARALFDCIHKVLYEAPADDWRSVEAEQGFLRYFFGDRSVQLPFWFNVQKTVNRSLHELWDEDRIVLLHYVGVKPHKTWSRSTFLTEFRDEGMKEKLRREDQNDDQDKLYLQTSKPWRCLFFELANLPAHLSMFALYHDAETYGKLQEQLTYFEQVEGFDPLLFVPLSLAEPIAPNELSTREVVPEVADPSLQLQLGETAALMALARAPWYGKPWVGFTTYSEQRKAVWREGVAVDWVRAERTLRGGAQQRVVLFWYGIFAGDYWELLHLHHEGMRPVFMHVLHKLAGVGHLAGVGPDFNMPKNRFWPFGNYIILPRTLLREYDVFLQAFIDHYTREYRGECPFKSMEGSRTNNFAARCLGYLTERLLHVWAVLAGVTLEYTVDYEEVRYEAGCRAHKVHCRQE